MSHFFLTLVYTLVVFFTLPVFAETSFKQVIQKNIDAKNYSYAVNIAKAEYGENPNVENFQLLRSIFVAQGKLKNWEQYVEQGVNGSPFDLIFLEELAKIDLENKNYVRAEALATRLYNLQNDKTQSLTLLVDIYKEQKKHEEAATLMQKLIETTKSPEILSQIHFKRADLFMTMSQPLKAQKDLDVYLTSNRPTQESYVLQHQIYSASSNPTGVKTNLKNCLETFPASQECFLMSLKAEGTAHLQSVGHFEKNAAAFIKNSEILVLVSGYYEELKNPDKAESILIQNAALNPSSFEQSMPLLSFYQRTNQLLKANIFLGSLEKNSEFSDQVKKIRSSLLEQSSVNVFGAKTSLAAAATTPQVKMSEAARAPAAEVSTFGATNYADKKFDALLANKNFLEKNHPNYYFRLGNVFYSAKRFYEATTAWKRSPKTAPTYLSAQKNAAVAQVFLNVKSPTIEFLKRLSVPEEEMTNITKMIEIIELSKSRRPAGFDYEKNVKAPLEQFLNLNWE